MAEKTKINAFGTSGVPVIESRFWLRGLDDRRNHAFEPKNKENSGNGTLHLKADVHRLPLSGLKNTWNPINSIQP